MPLLMKHSILEKVRRNRNYINQVATFQECGDLRSLAHLQRLFLESSTDFDTKEKAPFSLLGKFVVDVMMKV